MPKMMEFEDIKTDIQESKYKRVAMFDKNGVPMVPWNSRNTPLSKRLSEIAGRMKSVGTPDGIYQIHAKHNGPKAIESIYYTAKGDIDKGLADIEVSAPADDKTKAPVVMNGATISYKVHNELFQEKVELEYEVKDLKRQIKELDDTIDEMLKDMPEEGEEEKGKGLLSERNKDFFESTIDTLTPLVDRILDQKEYRLKLDHLYLTNGVPDGKQPPRNATEKNEVEEQEGDEITDEEEVHMDAMENLKENFPEVYNIALQRLDEHNANNSEEEETDE